MIKTHHLLALISDNSCFYRRRSIALHDNPTAMGVQVM
jgi:hypothetical protein